MKHRIFLAGFFLLLTGCGHNMYIERERTGFAMTIPLGENTEVGVTIGTEKSVAATVRGGASFESSSSNGGGIMSGSGGQSKITQFKSNIQLNEGNLVEIFTSPDVDTEVKCILASNLTGYASAPYFPGSILQTKESTIHIGRAAILSNNVNQIQSTAPTGLDNLVTTTGQAIHDLVNPLEGTVNSTTNVVSSVDQTIDNALKGAKSLSILIGCIIASLLLLFVAAAIFKKKFPRAKKVHVDDEPDPESVVATEPLTDHFDEDINASETALNEAVVVKPSQPPVEEEQPTSTKPPSIGWWRHILKFLLNAVLMLARCLRMIPPETRKKLVNMAVAYWQQLRAKKLEAKQQKKK